MVGIDEFNGIFCALRIIRNGGFDIFHKRIYPNEDPKYGYVYEKWSEFCAYPFNYLLYLDEMEKHLLMEWINELIFDKHTLTN